MKCLLLLTAIARGQQVIAQQQQQPYVYQQPVAVQQPPAPVLNQPPSVAVQQPIPQQPVAQQPIAQQQLGQPAAPPQIPPQPSVKVVPAAPQVQIQPPLIQQPISGQQVVAPPVHQLPPNPEQVPQVMHQANSVPLAQAQVQQPAYEQDAAAAAMLAQQMAAARQQQQLQQQHLQQQQFQQQQLQQQQLQQQQLQQQQLQQQQLQQQQLQQQQLVQHQLQQQQMYQAAQQPAAPAQIYMAQDQAAAAQRQQAYLPNGQLGQKAPPQASGYGGKVVSVKGPGKAAPAQQYQKMQYESEAPPAETIASEWDKHMKNFMPQMILTFRLNGGEAEHFHQDVETTGTLIRGGWFESTTDTGNAGAGGGGARRHIGFKILSPSGRLVYSSEKPEGLFRLECEETGTYTFAISSASWAKAKFVTYVMGTGEVSALSSSDITSIDGNIKMLYRMLSEIETHNNLLWARHRAQAGQIRKTSNKTYYAFIIELLCTAAAIVAQLATVKKMISKRSMF